MILQSIRYIEHAPTLKKDKYVDRTFAIHQELKAAMSQYKDKPLPNIGCLKLRRDTRRCSDFTKHTLWLASSSNNNDKVIVKLIYEHIDKDCNIPVPNAFVIEYHTISGLTYNIRSQGYRLNTDLSPILQRINNMVAEVFFVRGGTR